ncbi:MAG: hypothetical protein N0E48_15960 [Candidatus Thiodiazotropha endolucinida]|nr:hypothetical protein [Candidatus Thiodiazotropha taylori]MCW4344826.1 hypothetical protein [Candidatus Thiodiazotropha endolucinida]
MIYYYGDAMPYATLEEFYKFFQQHQPRIEVWVRFRTNEFEYSAHGGNSRSGVEGFHAIYDADPMRFTRSVGSRTIPSLMRRRGDPEDIQYAWAEHVVGSYEYYLAISGSDVLVIREETPVIANGRIDLSIKELPPIKMQITGVPQFIVFNFDANGYVAVTCSADPDSDLPISNLALLENVTTRDILAFPSMYFYHEDVN